MRKDKVRALTWKRVNFKTNEICINKGISHEKDNKLYVNDTKTDDFPYH